MIYTGIKVVDATPMSIEEASAKLGREIVSAGADTNGYFIEYEDGYQSWCPKSVFEKCYHLSETTVDRMKLERHELLERQEKLYDFINSDSFSELPFRKRADLKEQYEAMRSYNTVLLRRIVDLEGVDEPVGTKMLSFGDVINGLREGRCYRRLGWNGKGLFICKQIPAKLEGMIVEKLQNLPQTAKDILMTREGTPVINYSNQMLIINPDGRADSWVPSSSDIFATDWEIVAY